MALLAETPRKRCLMQITGRKNIMKLTEKQLEKVKDLVDDLGWEHQRMSSSGKESYEKLCRILGWEFVG